MIISKNILKVQLYFLALTRLLLTGIGQELFETGVIDDKWCPPQCDCFNYFETVDCSRRSLAFLPRQSKATRRLYLESNQLEEIPENAFTSVDKLSVLILENNRLAFLSTASFCNLNELQELDVGSNQLTLFKVQISPDQSILDSWYQSSQYDGTNKQSSSLSSSSSSSSSLHPDGNNFLNLSSADYLDSKSYHVVNQSAEASNETDTVLQVGDSDSSHGSFVNFIPFNYDESNRDESNQGEANKNYDEFISDKITSRATECKAISLREINLSHNQLRTVPYGLAWFAPNLEILNLAYNQITTAKVDSSYSLMTSLRYLDLSRNDIRHLKQNDFEAFKKSDKSSLETINLSDCGLLQIDPLTFEGLNSLTSLTLARSLVNRTLLEVVFSYFPADNKMTRLDLSETFLTNLTLKMVINFKRLVSLLASYCDLEFIEPKVFESLPYLETLHLEGGQLTRLTNLTALKKLRRISLHLNQMSELSLGGITGLEYVDLSYNKFSSMKAGWISGSDQIQQINISHNQLTAIGGDFFSSISSISTLDLSHNALSTLNTLGPLKVSNLDVSNNRLSSIEESFFDILHQSLTNLDLSSNQFTQFRYVFKSFHLLQTINLANNKLGGAFKSGKLGNLMESLQLVQVLDLSNNGISVLHSEHLTPLRHLSTLLLQGNQIRDVRDTGLESLRVLAKLVVSGNQLHTLDAQVLGQLEYLEELDASDNPFECTCDLSPFIRWTNTTQTTVISIRDQISAYLCDFPPDVYGVSVFDDQISRDLAACQSEGGERREGGGDESGAELPEDDVVMATSFKAEEKETTGWSDNRKIFVGALSVLCLVGGLGCVGVTCYVTQVCRKVKGLKYRWQIRYREVSAVETGVCDGK